VIQSAYNSFWEGIFVPQDRTRKIVVAGVLSAITIILGITKWGFIPWFSGFSITIMPVPVIIGAILEGPIVGFVIGLIFGLFSLLQAAIAPNGPGDVIFTNPLISVLPRLFIGPIAWLVWIALRRIPIVGLVIAGVAGCISPHFGHQWITGSRSRSHYYSGCSCRLLTDTAGQKTGR
jgi:uncharacterized membrane protein